MGLLGEMTVKFGVDLSALNQGASQAKSILGGLASTPLGALAAGVGAVGAAAIGIGAASVKAAADFQSSMLKVQAYAGLSKADADSMSASLLQMATVVGQSPKALADAIYPIMSAGYSGAQALNILKLSAETAAASGAKTSVVADALTTALHATGASATQAGAYMDIMNKTVSAGKMEFPGYAAIIGKLSLTAVGAKVPFTDMNAALATLSTHGFPSVAQASNSLGNLFTQIGVKTDALEQHAKKLKIAFDAHAFSTMSLSDKIAYLNKITGGNQSELLKLVGGSTLALKAFNALAGGADSYKQNLNSLQHASGATDAAFKTASSGFNASMQRVQASIDVVKIKIGNALLPALTSIANQVGPLITKFGQWVEKNHIVENGVAALKTGIANFTAGVKTGVTVTENIVKNLQNMYHWFQQNKPVIQNTAMAITAFYIPALIKAGVESVISGAKMAGSFIVNVYKVGIEGWQAAIKLGTFVAQMIATGVQAVIAGAKVVASFIASLIQAGVKAVAAGAQIAASFVAQLIATGAQAITAAAQVTASFIASLVQAGLKAIIAGAQIAGSFVVSLVTAGAQAVVTGASMLASLVPAIISVIAETTIAAVTAIPGLVVAFGAWTIGAFTAAAATIAATWPILLIVGIIILAVAIIIVCVRNWGAISKFLTNMWQIAWAWLQGFWANIQVLFNNGMNNIKNIISNIGGTLYNLFVQPFIDAKNFIGGVIDGIKSKIGDVINIGKNIGSTLHNAGIPGFATGVKNFSGGWAVVGEAGPELLKLPSGSDVYPHGVIPNSGGAASAPVGGSGTQTITVQLDSQVIMQAVSDKQARQVRLQHGRRAA